MIKSAFGEIGRESLDRLAKIKKMRKIASGEESHRSQN
jgi:hypothetical protein